MNLKNSHSFKNSPVAIFMLSFILAGISHLLAGTGSDTIPVLEWLVAITLALIINNPWLYPGIFSGYLTASALASYQTGLVQTTGQFVEKTFVTAICILVSVWIIRKTTFLKPVHLWISLIFLLACLGWISFQFPDVKIVLIYFSAALIVSILTIVKNKQLNSIPARFFFSWLPAYIIWLISVMLLQLDPESFNGIFSILRKYVLVPYSEFLLGILIASHIVNLINQEKTSYISVK